MMSRLPRPLGIFVATVALVAVGCTNRDGWQHYASGGMYPSHWFGIDETGQTLVLSSPVSGHGDIYKVNLVTGSLTQITDNEQFESHPIMPRDGARIAFGRAVSGYDNLWLYDTASRTERQIT